jgi:hypothetical protein
MWPWEILFGEVERVLKEFLANPEARLVARAAKALGRDPLEALGLPPVPLVGEVAILALALVEPELGEYIKEEEQVLAFKEEMGREDAWEDALPGGRGYRGPRGTAWTER